MPNHSVRRYAVPAEGLSLTWPIDAAVLHVHDRGREVCLWVRGTWDSEQVRPRRFILAMTGEQVPHRAAYVGTAHLEHIGIVAHVFEVDHG